MIPRHIVSISMEELDPVGGEPANPVAIAFDREVEGLDVKGYHIKCEKALVIGELRASLAKAMDVPAELFSLVWEGKKLNDDQTMSDNGVVEPGAAAKKRGAKLTLSCVFEEGVLPGYGKRALQEQTEKEAKAIENQRAEEERRKFLAAKAEEDRKSAERAKFLSLPPKEREKQANLDEESRKRLADIRVFLNQPNVKKAKLIEDDSEVPRMTREQIEITLRIHVLDIDTRIAPRSNGTKTLDFIVQTYNEGLPNYPEAVSKHLAACLRHALGLVRKQDEEIAPGASRRRALCTRLADAFEACQAVQARVIEQLAEELQEGPLFEREVMSMVVELKERTLEGVLLKLYPESGRSDISSDQQLAHIVNQYRQHFGMSGIDHSGTDRCAHKVSAADLEKATRSFDDELDVIDFIDAFVNDVNQPTGGVRTERRIDRKGFGIWAGEHPHIQHRVYFESYTDEQQKELFGDRAPEEADKYHPFIYRGLGLEILHEVLCKEQA